MRLLGLNYFCNQGNILSSYSKSTATLESNVGRIPWKNVTEQLTRICGTKQMPILTVTKNILWNSPDVRKPLILVESCRKQLDSFPNSS